ncbi:MAG: cytochrome c5 family protein [Betaproteobacteria bacterium]|nr:cytochrome c5 family protein [Betaproteobacteria bacterium]
MAKMDNKKVAGCTILTAVVSVAGVALLIFVWGKLFGLTDVIEVAPPVVVESESDANIKPVAQIEVAAAVEPGAAKAEKSGEEVVKAVCAMCHAAGLMNAPKIGDKGSWGPRVAQGYDILVKHAVEGIRTMPARGGNSALTDGEVAAAVKHMANASGASF